MVAHEIEDCKPPIVEARPCAVHPDAEALTRSNIKGLSRDWDKSSNIKGLEYILVVAPLAGSVDAATTNERESTPSFASWCRRIQPVATVLLVFE
jgi:hypothetical protein